MRAEKKSFLCLFSPSDFPPLITYTWPENKRGEREKTKLMNHHIESDLIYFFFELLICFDPFFLLWKLLSISICLPSSFHLLLLPSPLSSSGESILAEQDQFNTPARGKKVGWICYRHLENPVMFFFPLFYLISKKRKKVKSFLFILFHVYYTHCKKKGSKRQGGNRSTRAVCVYRYVSGRATGDRNVRARLAVNQSTSSPLSRLREIDHGLGPAATSSLLLLPPGTLLWPLVHSWMGNGTVMLSGRELNCECLSSPSISLERFVTHLAIDPLMTACTVAVFLRDSPASPVRLLLFCVVVVAVTTKLPTGKGHAHRVD